MLGCVENFFTNVENGNYEVDAGVALIHKGVEIKSYYINDNSSYDINDFSENLQCLACFPITLSSKGISFTQSKNILTSDVLSIGYTLSVRKPDLSKDLVRIGGTGFIDATLLGASINLGISAPVDNINNSLKIEAYSNYNKATTLKSPMRCFE